MCLVSNTLQECVEYPCSVDLTLSFFINKLFSPTQFKVSQHFTLIVTELRNSNCDNSKNQLGLNSRPKMVRRKKTKKKSFNCNKTQLLTNLKWRENLT